MPNSGLGQRLAEQIRAIKGGRYRDDDAKFKIKVTAFALDYHYPPQHCYKWLGDVVVPDYETILRLARDLDTTPGWLHYGDPPQLDTPPLKRKSPTKAGGRRGRDERLRQVGGQTAARALHYRAVTAAGGSGRRVA